MNDTMILAYHSANRTTAETIDRQLSRANYSFEHLVCNKGELRLHERMSQTSKKVILLVSDNFLCCEDCMYELLPIYQEYVRTRRVLPVVIDGVYHDEETGITTRKATSFDRMSNVIHYMNYWQDQYLEVRRQKRLISSEEELALNEELRVIRSISSEIGEFLRFFRNGDYLHWNVFKANRYYSFFDFANDLNTHQTFEALDIQDTEYPLHQEEEEEEIADLELIEPIGAPITDVEIIESSEEEMETTVEVLRTNVETEITEQQEEIAVDPIEEEYPIETADIPGINLLHLSEEETIEEEEEETPITSPLSEAVEEEITFEIAEREEEVAVPEHVEEVAEMEEETEPTLEEETEITDTAIAPTEAEEDSNSTAEETLVTAEEVHFDSVETIIESGNQLIAEGQVYTALRRFEEGIARYPENVGLRYTFAQAILQYREDFGSARRQLEKMLEYDARNTDAYFLMGEIDEIQDNFDSAKLNFERVINIDSTYPQVHYRLANLLANKFEGKEDAAIYHFSIAIDQANDNADAHYQYAVLQESYADNQERAIEHFQQTIALRPDHPYAHYDLAVLYHQLGQRELAETSYRQAIALNPEVRTVQNDRVFLAVPVQNGQPQEEVAASKALIGQLQTDIQRLEDLVTKNQNLLQHAQQDIADLPIMRETPTPEAKEEMPPAPLEPVGTILITGATSGIGKATADLFAAKNYRLILTGRRIDRLKILKEYYEEQFQSEVFITNFDVRDADAAEAHIYDLPEEWRDIDILVNNAGLAKGFEPIHEGKLSDWETMIDTNIKGLLYMTRLVSPWMVKRGKGHIINICSTAGKEVYPNGGVYCATKHAVDALTKAMRLDLHQHGIRVSQVSPAHVEETEFALVRFDGDQERASIYNDFQPLKASDVADTIFFLATRPAHVNIQDVLLMGTQQASSTVIDRSGR
jgi:NADP-dependent 3-hydroxy acid dehydrogenase YdfG/Flp pilus assembly protein TadD